MRMASILTKSDISIAHPRRDGEVFIRSKSGDFVSCHYVPNDCCLASVITDYQSSAALFTLIINSQKLNLV